MSGELKGALRTVARGGRLERAETRAAFSEMLDGESAEVPALLAGALLCALAARGESEHEVAGVVDVLRAKALRPPVEESIAEAAVDVCGTGGDGLGTFNVSTAAACVVAGAGVPVAKHGGRAVSSTCGSADVLGTLGVQVEMSPERAAEALRRAGLTFLFAPLYHGAMRRVAPLRKELGVRTVFNLAGPLANPLGVRRQIVGVDRPERVLTIARALAALGAARAFVFANAEGGDELLPWGSSSVAEVRQGEVARTFSLQAEDFGLPEEAPEALKGGDAAQNAAILRAVLAGERGAPRTVVVMNAAAALFAAERVGSFREGVDAACAAIDDGRASRALEGLAAASRGEALPG